MMLESVFNFMENVKGRLHSDGSKKNLSKGDIKPSSPFPSVLEIYCAHVIALMVRNDKNKEKMH